MFRHAGSSREGLHRNRTESPGERGRTEYAGMARKGWRRASGAKPQANYTMETQVGYSGRKEHRFAWEQVQC